MRPDDPDPATIEVLAAHIFPERASLTVERVPEGVSTFVYRIRRGSQTLYLRILPEIDASFAPEAYAHRTLRARGVRVPEVVYVEHCNEIVQRSVMVTTEIEGCHVGQRPVDGATHRILFEAGQQLAIINSIPVDGFGWIKRDQRDVHRLEAEHPTHRAFATAHLEDDLAALEGRILNQSEITAIRSIVERHASWLETEHGRLAHGDFDVTHIFQQDGRYTGIIDLGEIRGADLWYDLGHFRAHDGETLPAPLLDHLVAGYREVTPLPDDHHQRICFTSLLLALRALAHRLHKYPRAVHVHQALLR
ncbi:MAG: phosphotransferase family protein, partial [Dehalococcoidia bacterium]